jgi:hypothetical protein
VLKRLPFIFLVIIAIQVQAQTAKRNFRQRELGVFLGGSYYLGDLNPYRHFAGTKPAAGLLFRYTTNYRYAFRFGFNYGSIEAYDSKSNSPDQLLRNANFRSKLYDFHALAEFNFVEYRIGHSKHYFTMFIFGGIGAFRFSPEGDIGNGWTSLQPLRTEGQSKAYPLVQINVPFGVGFKYNVSDYIGIGVEWGPRKTFTDYLDDVSGLYPDPKVNPPAGNGMAYAYRSKDSYDLTGTMRGNPRTKDWYFFYGLTINIKLPGGGNQCYGVGMNK